MFVCTLWSITVERHHLGDAFCMSLHCFRTFKAPLDLLFNVSVFGALVYIDVDKAAIKALLTLMYIPLKDT